MFYADDHDKEKDDRLARARDAERLLIRLTPVLVMVITVASFFGLREILGAYGIIGNLSPVVLALGAGLGLSWLWHSLLRNVPHDRYRDNRSLLVALAMLLTLIGFGFSAWPMTTTIGRKIAINAHMEAAMPIIQEALAATDRRIEPQRAILNDVRRAQASFETSAQSEMSGGLTVPGGRAGPGPVSQTFSDLAARFSLVGDQMGAALTKADAVREIAQRTFNAMNDVVADSTLNPDARQAKFADLVGKYRASIDTRAHTDLVGLLGGFNATVPYRSRTPAGNQAIRDAQKSALEMVEGIRRAALLNQNTDEIKPLVFQPINVGMAVVRYFDETFPAWAMSLGLDCLPLLALGILIHINRGTRRAARDGEEPGDPRQTEDPPVAPHRPDGGGTPGAAEIRNFPTERKRPAAEAGE